MLPESATNAPTLWDQYIIAMDKVTARLDRITNALEAASVPYALGGGQAVAMWVATKDPSTVRTTKDVDILLRRADLPRARAAALSVNMDYCEVVGVGMFLERDSPDPRHAVRLIWADERVRPDHPIPAPTVDEQCTLVPGKSVVSLRGLVAMKLAADRDQDRVHLRDMIDVGLIQREILPSLHPALAERSIVYLRSPDDDRRVKRTPQ
jgi:hypothetical protein